MLSEKPWKIEAVLRLVLALIVSMLSGAFLASLLRGGEQASVPNSVDLTTIVISTMSFHGATVVLVYFFLRYHGLSWSSAFGFNSPRQAFAVILVLVASFVTVPATMFLGKLSGLMLEWIQVKPEMQAPVKALRTASTAGSQVYLAIMAVAIAPVAEEMLFRGILYPVIKAAGYPRLALWGTSILFGASHLNLATFLPLTFLALALTWLYEKTDNLLAPILAHSLFNTANFFLLVFERQGSLTPAL